MPLNSDHLQLVRLVGQDLEILPRSIANFNCLYHAFLTYSNLQNFAKTKFSPHLSLIFEEEYIPYLEVCVPPHLLVLVVGKEMWEDLLFPHLPPHVQKLLLIPYTGNNAENLGKVR